MLKISDLKIIVLGDNHEWAKGDTIEDAVAKCHKPRHYIAWVVHPETTVGGLGELVYPQSEDGSTRPLRIFRKLPKVKVKRAGKGRAA